MNVIGIISTIVVGFVIGLIARALLPGADKLGFWLTSFLGIGGSLVGGLIGSLLSKSPDGRFRPAGILLSIVGAVLLLWGYNQFLK